MRINKLSPNPQKTEYMAIGHPRKMNALHMPGRLEIDGSELNRVLQTKSLGVIVDGNLKWDEHYKVVKGKIYGGLASLRKLRNILSQSKLCNVYHAVVESHLRYADVIWRSLPETKLMTLQQLQNMAKMIIKNAKHKDEWSDSLLSVKNLFRFDRSVMTYKILKKISPNNLWEKFYLKSAYSRYDTISYKNLQTPKLKTELMRKSFQYSSVKD